MPLFCSLEPLKGYQGEDIEIQLPKSLTMHAIDWLAVWCVQHTHNFGHVNIPDDLDVPPALGQTTITVSSAVTRPPKPTRKPGGYFGFIQQFFPTHYGPLSAIRTGPSPSRDRNFPVYTRWGVSPTPGGFF